MPFLLQSLRAEGFPLHVDTQTLPYPLTNIDYPYTSFDMSATIISHPHNPSGMSATTIDHPHTPYDISICNTSKPLH